MEALWGLRLTSSAFFFFLGSLYYGLKPFKYIIIVLILLVVGVLLLCVWVRVSALVSSTGNVAQVH